MNGNSTLPAHSTANQQKLLVSSTPTSMGLPQIQSCPVISTRPLPTLREHFAEWSADMNDRDASTAFRSMFAKSRKARYAFKERYSARLGRPCPPEVLSKSLPMIEILASRLHSFYEIWGQEVDLAVEFSRTQNIDLDAFRKESFKMNKRPQQGEAFVLPIDSHSADAPLKDTKISRQGEARRGRARGRARGTRQGTRHEAGHEARGRAQKSKRSKSGHG